MEMNLINSADHLDSDNRQPVHVSWGQIVVENGKTFINGIPAEEYANRVVNSSPSTGPVDPDPRNESQLTLEEPSQLDKVLLQRSQVQSKLAQVRSSLEELLQLEWPRLELETQQKERRPLRVAKSQVKAVRRNAHKPAKHQLGQDGQATQPFYDRKGQPANQNTQLSHVPHVRTPTLSNFGQNSTGGAIDIHGRNDMDHDVKQEEVEIDAILLKRLD